MDRDSIAILPPHLTRKKRLERVGDFALSSRLSLAVISLTLAGSVGVAEAQYYPPPPPPPVYQAYPPPPPVYYQGYPPPPPVYYQGYPPPPYARPDQGQGVMDAPPAPYGRAPTVYRDANGAPPTGDEEADAFPPPTRPYFAPGGSPSPQPMPSWGDSPVPRPPGDIRDVTGSVPGPAGSNTPGGSDHTSVIASLPPDVRPEQGPPKELPPQFRRQVVDYVTTEPAGTIIIDTPHTYLYLVLGDGTAMRYGIGVGREGFTWTGTERIRRMSEWPDWHPPKEMIERQPYLPRFMAGGEGNPLGARALYLGNTLYRIHGTNQPSTIGSFVSSGCIRLTNADIEDLYARVSVGTRVVVLPGASPAAGVSPAASVSQGAYAR